jgi:Tol biopolymer transport system component
MNADGTEPIKLTINRERDDAPTWSPDGQRIAFQSRRDRNEEIYVMRANGRGQVNLTDNPANGSHSAWSHEEGRALFPGHRIHRPKPAE